VGVTRAQYSVPLTIAGAAFPSRRPTRDRRLARSPRSERDPCTRRAAPSCFTKAHRVLRNRRVARLGRATLACSVQGLWWALWPCWVWCTTYFTHWPWFLNDGESKFRQPPFLQSAFVDGVVAVGAGTWS